ncbi:MAG: hypothetical protein AB7K52_02705 [Phycisphaerales bacterium]
MGTAKGKTDGEKRATAIKVAVASVLLVVAGGLITWQVWPRELAVPSESSAAAAESAGPGEGTTAAATVPAEEAPRPPAPGDPPRGNYRSAQ